MRNEQNLEAKKWIEIAIKDLEASEILFKNKLYPQSLYFFHQSLEKLNKALLISLKFIERGIEIKHNLRDAPAKPLYKAYNEIFDEILDRMEQSKKKKLYKAKNKIKFLKRVLQPSDFQKITKLAIGYHMIRKLDKSHDKRFLKETLNRLNKEHAKYNKAKQRVLKQIKKFEISKNNIDNFNNMIKIYSDFVLDGMGYVISVAYRLIFILPEQNRFRYPEFNPIETYKDNHLLIKNFNSILRHLKISCNFFKNFWVDSWTQNIDFI